MAEVSITTDNSIINKVNTNFMARLDAAQDVLLNPGSSGSNVHKASVLVSGFNQELLTLMGEIIGLYSKGVEFSLGCQTAYFNFLKRCTTTCVVPTDGSDQSITDDEKQRTRNSTFFMISLLKSTFNGMLYEYNAHSTTLKHSTNETAKTLAITKAQESTKHLITKHKYSLEERKAHKAKTVCRYAENCKRKGKDCCFLHPSESAL